MHIAIKKDDLIVNACKIDHQSLIYKSVIAY